MRTLQVTTIPETLEAFLLPFATHFRDRGWVVDAAARAVSGNAACVAAFDSLHDIPWSRNPLHPTNWRAAVKLRSLLEREHYDLIHVHTPVASFLARWAASRVDPSPAVVYTAHGFHFHAGGNPLLNLAFSNLERIAAPWTTELVVINKDDQEAAAQLRLLPADRIHFIPGIGFDVEEFLTRSSSGLDRAQMKAELGIPPEAKVVMMVAEFTPNKRQVDAVDAVAGLGRSDVHIVFVGVGPMRGAVEERVRGAGIADRAHFLGYRRDVPQLLPTADAMMLISLREGLPRSAMEAMALGVPMIGTNIRGLKDLLGGGAGVLVTPADVQALTAALTQILDGGPMVESRVTEARRRVATYALPNVLAQYETVYARAVTDRRS